jgi:UDPglucose 6-dehydrogenase
MQIGIAGAGHVGLVTASCLGALGHRVRVYDVDAGLIEALSDGRPPFIEEGVPALLRDGLSLGRLSFHADPAEAFGAAEMALICVGTPNDGEGTVDLSAVVSAARSIARSARRDIVIVNRSTAPVGTAQYVRSIAEEQCGWPVTVAVNPEFLAEGTAVRDFLAPDRLVIGAWDQRAVSGLLRAYHPVIHRLVPHGAPLGHADASLGPVPVVVTSPPTAELAKYAANAFLAMKISFINEMASIAEELGGDVRSLAAAVGLDHRIGSSFLRAGIGWGGSCFPKDIVALQDMAETRGLSARMLKAANDVNRDRHRWVVRKLQRHMRTLVGRRVTLLGLSFKPDTDDLRNAPSLDIALALRRLGARVRAYDPAVRALPADLEGLLEVTASIEAAAAGAEALVLVTEWQEFARLDLPALRRLMRTPLLLDGRNLFDPTAARNAGFVYVSVGQDEPDDPPLHLGKLATGGAALLSTS